MVDPSLVPPSDYGYYPSSWDKDEENEEDNDDVNVEMTCIEVGSKKRAKNIASIFSRLKKSKRESHFEPDVDRTLVCVANYDVDFLKNVINRFNNGDKFDEIKGFYGD